MLGKWAGDSEISMIPLVNNDITAAIYQIIIDNENNNIFYYNFINIIGSFEYKEFII